MRTFEQTLSDSVRVQAYREEQRRGVLHDEFYQREMEDLFKSLREQHETAALMYRIRLNIAEVKA